jgi:hypothetical protein
MHTLKSLIIPRANCNKLYQANAIQINLFKQKQLLFKNRKSIKKLNIYDSVIISSHYVAKIIAKHYKLIKPDMNFYIIGETSYKALYKFKNAQLFCDIKEFLSGNNFLKNACYLTCKDPASEIPYATKFIVYKNIYKRTISKKIIYKIKSFDTHCVLLYSKKSTTHAITLLKNIININSCDFIAISANVKSYAISIGIDANKILISENKTESSMLNAFSYDYKS